MHIDIPIENVLYSEKYIQALLEVEAAQKQYFRAIVRQRKAIKQKAKDLP